MARRSLGLALALFGLARAAAASEPIAVTTALHARDKGKYRAPPGAADHWEYSGLCYADAVLA